MQVVINGQSQELSEAVTVGGLIAAHGLNPKHVAVEVNEELVVRRLFDTTTIREGDRIEIVTLVGGG